MCGGLGGRHLFISALEIYYIIINSVRNNSNKKTDLGSVDVTFAL